MDPSTALTLVLFAFLLWQVSRAFIGKASPEKARAAVEAGAQLLDVRSASEHEAGHLAGSIHVPVGELAKRLGELGEKSRPVVVYCASGMRSASAAKMLRRAGFTEVLDLGAMARWRS